MSSETRDGDLSPVEDLVMCLPQRSVECPPAPENRESQSIAAQPTDLTEAGMKPGPIQTKGYLREDEVPPWDQTVTKATATGEYTLSSGDSS